MGLSLPSEFWANAVTSRAHHDEDPRAVTERCEHRDIDDGRQETTLPM